MTHKLFFWLLATFLLTTASHAWAQQVQKASRIGFLANVATTAAIELKPFRERLRELGYSEGQNFALEHRYWEGKVERLPALAEELVRLKCDVIVTSGTEAGNAARNATRTIPVVLAFGVDVLRLGFVKDLARPSGNITGMTSIGRREKHRGRIPLPRITAGTRAWFRGRVGATQGGHPSQLEHRGA